MKKKLLILLICVMVFTLVTAISLYAITTKKSMQYTNDTIETIKHSIAEQNFANNIGSGVTATRDCYPVDSNISSCVSLTFEVTKQTCLESEKAFLEQSQKSEKSDCGPTYATTKYKGKTIKYYFGAGSLQSTYWVQVWVE
jgi:hypothetical protein